MPKFKKNGLGCEIEVGGQVIAHISPKYGLLWNNTRVSSSDLRRIADKLDEMSATSTKRGIILTFSIPDPFDE